MKCQSCGVSFDARADAKFCSGRCRVRAHRAGQPPIPARMRRAGRWVTHRAKVPITPFGAFARVNDPATWADYATARRAADRPGIDGVGFVLDGDGIACIDLDHCLDGDQLAPWAQDILDRCPPTYVEVSPSGRGLHVFGLAHVGRGRRGNGAEVYDRGRYICVTGIPFRGSINRLADITDAVAMV